MSMTDHSNLANINVKAVESNEVQFYVGSGTTKATLKLNSSPGSDYDINLPGSSGTIALTSDIDSLPSATQSGQIMVADSSFDFQAVDASGAVTLDSSGAFTIANDAIDSQHIDANAVQDEHIQNLCSTDGTSDASCIPKTDASNNLAGFNELGCADMKASASLVINDEWRLKINNNNLELQYSSDSGSTWNVKQIFQSS